MAASTDPATTDHGEQLLLRLVVAFVAGKELAGLASHHTSRLNVRTWSRHMWDLPMWKRVLVWFLVVLILTDHFVMRWWT